METAAEYAMRIEQALGKHFVEKLGRASITHNGVNLRFYEATGELQIRMNEPPRVDGYVIQTTTEAVIVGLEEIWNHGFVQVFSQIINEDHPNKVTLYADPLWDPVRLRIGILRQVLKWREGVDTTNTVVEFKRKA